MASLNDLPPTRASLRRTWSGCTCSCPTGSCLPTFLADLVLWLPDRDGRRYHAGAQMRPTTGPTAFSDDLVGIVVRRGERPLIDAAFDEGRICREGDPEWRQDVPVRVETIRYAAPGRSSPLSLAIRTC